MSRILGYVIVWLLILLFSSPSWAQNEPKAQDLAPNQEDTIKVETTLINVPILYKSDSQYNPSTLSSFTATAMA